MFPSISFFLTIYLLKILSVSFSTVVLFKLLKYTQINLRPYFESRFCFRKTWQGVQDHISSKLLGEANAAGPQTTLRLANCRALYCLDFDDCTPWCHNSVPVPSRLVVRSSGLSGRPLYTKWPSCVTFIFFIIITSSCLTFNVPPKMYILSTLEVFYWYPCSPPTSFLHSLRFKAFAQFIPMALCKNTFLGQEGVHLVVVKLEDMPVWQERRPRLGRRQEEKQL